MKIHSLVLLTAVAACGSPTTSSTTLPVSPPARDPVAPTLRLPTDVRPVRNAVELTIDPSATTFTGVITTELNVITASNVIWLNAHEISVDKATITVAGKAMQAKPIVQNDYLGIVLPSALPVGAATLRIEYRGQIHPGDGDGIYTAKEAEEWYAFTQFEATDARQAFPCFDEPSFKVPWQLTLHTKQSLVALSNTPIESETAQADGTKTTRFAETKPLPSYLVAFAVGPFDLIDAGKTRSGVPLRVVVPRGRSADASYPVAVTAPILALLEDYFGMPYPYAKLDMVAVSIFNAGAMENPGLITFRQSMMVVKPSDHTLTDDKTYASVAAHEMAHQWFGDYVTMAWWDDTWLNESFANWMEAKIIAQWKPEWEREVTAVANKSSVMRRDGLATARAVRQPIETRNDIANAFDGITYAKGEAVLNMVEHALGADVFQRGVRLHMQKHAFGNATYSDFVASLSEASKSDQLPMFDSFIVHSGVPLLTVEASCTADKNVLRLSQQRYVPTGSSIDPKRTWTLPVCVRYGSKPKGAGNQACVTMTEPTAELPLASCPTWVMPNRGAVGYYRALLKGDLLQRMLSATDALTLAERVGLLGDVNAMVDSGDVQKSLALSLVQTLAKDPHRQIVDETLGVVGSIDDLVPESLRPNYQRFIQKLYGARAKELGWANRSVDDPNTKELRPKLLYMVAQTGRDADGSKTAALLVDKWLTDRKAVDAEMVDVALAVATRDGNQALYDRLHDAAKNATDHDERERLLGAMGGFRDPAIVKQGLALVLTDEFEIRDSVGLLVGSFASQQNRQLGYQFIKTNFDTIAAKLPAMYRPFMAFSFVPLCDDSLLPEIESYFGPKINAFDGGPRSMAQAIEQMKLCSAQRKAQTPGVIEFLKRQ
jgi:cytosol alanyl aminopeptidase